MLKKFIFIALAASLAFSAQQLVVKNKSAANLSKDAADRLIATTLERISKEFEIKDKILNKAYKKSMSVLNEEDKKRLKDIQRKRAAYKEAKSPFVPPHVVSLANGYLKVTKERTQELKYATKEFKASL